MREPARPPRLYAIADAETLAPVPVDEAVVALVEAGVRWIQIRAKKASGRELFQTVEACCRALDGREDVSLWVDDRADIAALLPVAGVHVGQEDLPPRAVREVVGDDVWIGLSTHGREQLIAAEGDPDVDLVALGPIFATQSKERPDPVVGLERLARLRFETTKPLVAIGGIDEGNCSEVLAAGADSVALLGAICRPPLTRRARRLQQAVEGSR